MKDTVECASVSSSQPSNSETSDSTTDVNSNMAKINNMKDGKVKGDEGIEKQKNNGELKLKEGTVCVTKTEAADESNLKPPRTTTGKTSSFSMEKRSEEPTTNFYMESLLQHHKQMYDQCTSNWINVQRTDNNCLSKSKAERYRWCVQNVDGKTQAGGSKSNSTHVQNLKKTTSMLGSTNPIQDKLYNTVFTGASKFRCRDCGKSFNTLVNLTVHMNKTGHYRDENLSTGNPNIANSNTSNKKNKINRNFEEGKVAESAEKVLKCMGCGYSFDSLQDLSVHMMKTKHYEQVPSLHYWSQRYNNQPQSNDKPKQTASHSTTNSSSKQESKSLNYSQPTPSMLPGLHNLAQLSAALSNQSSSMFPYPPYFMPMMPFTPFNNYQTNPALAAASLLLANPWLAQLPGYSPAMFPGLFNNSLLKQGSFPTQLSSAPSSSPPHSSSPEMTKELRGYDIESSNTLLTCEECQISFNSLQKLGDHIKVSGHFPIAQASSKRETISDNHTTSKSPATSSPKLISSGAGSSEVVSIKRHAVSRNNNSVKRSRTTQISPPIPVDKFSKSQLHLRNKYLNPLPPKNSKSNSDKNDSVDFIKSLESTIQSAISKVADDGTNHVRKRRRDQTNNEMACTSPTAFSMFSKLSHSNFNTISAAESKKRPSSLSPLDLSSYDSAEKKNDSQNSRLEFAAKRSRSNSYHSINEKDHIKCIRDNMRSLFSYMNLQNSERVAPNMTVKQEAIVGTKLTDERSKSMSPQTNNDRATPNNKTPKGHEKPERPKRRSYQDSILQDLFIPSDDVKPPTQNPLLQMENLVNHQLGPADYGRKTSRTTNWPRHSPKNHEARIPSPKNDENNNKTKNSNPMSALLDFFANSGNYTQLPNPPRKTPKLRRPPSEKQTELQSVAKKSPCHDWSSSEDVTHDQAVDEQLSIKMAYFLHSMANSRQNGKTDHSRTSSPTRDNEMSELQHAIVTKNICKKLLKHDQINQQTCVGVLRDFDCEKLSTAIDVPPSVIKKWVDNQMRLLRDRSHCDFIIINENDTSVQFKCYFCSAFDATTDAELFSEHISNHATEFDRISLENGNTEKKSFENVQIRTKSEPEMEAPSPLSDLKPPLSVANSRTQIGNKLKVDADPIQVSG